MIACQRFVVCCVAVGLAVLGVAGCRREKPKSVYEIQEETRRELDRQQRRWEEERAAARSEPVAPLTPEQQAERDERRRFDEAQMQGNVREASDQWIHEGPIDNPGPDEEGFDEDESEDPDPEPEAKQPGAE